MRLAAIEVLIVEFPFRFSFGHALASRRASSSVIVRMTTDTGVVGFGEGVPREYVTGETPAGAQRYILDQLGPALLGLEMDRLEQAPELIRVVFDQVEGTAVAGAACCAVELAVLDTVGRAFGRSVGELLGERQRDVIRYSGALPFLPLPVMALGALMHRAYGITTLKLKVGRDLGEDRRNLRILRRVLGPRADLRVDANCGWTPEQAIASIRALQRYRLQVVEQPVAQDDLVGLKRVTDAVDVAIMADESLRSLDDARRLAADRTVDMFNIRISKCGGLLRAREVAAIAAEAGLTCQLGIHPGESAILGAAGRLFAAHTVNLRYFEADALNLLVKQSITDRSTGPGRGGLAQVQDGPGLGIVVNEQKLRRFVVDQQHVAAAG